MRRARSDRFGFLLAGSPAVHCILAGGILCLAAGAGLWVAQPVTAESAGTEGVTTVEDVRLTVQARQTLREDAQLQPLNVCVVVRGRVATLSGPVPSSEMARRAEERLRQVDGILRVVNELRPDSPEDAAVTSFTPLGRPRPVPQPPHPGTLTGQSGSPQGKPHVTAGGTMRPPTGPDGEPLLTLPTIRLSVPAPDAAGTSVAKPRSAENVDPHAGLTQAIEQLRRSEARFRDLQARIDDGALFLRGSVQRGEDQMDFAQRLRQLPGVTRVVIEDVRVGKR